MADKPPSPQTIRMTAKDRALIEELKDEFDVSTTSEVMRRSIAQASFLSDLAEDGFLTVRKGDKEYKVPLKF